jgi:hypothetical protein
MRKDIGCYPYKVQIVQKLLCTDAHSHLSFAERFLEVTHSDNNFLTNLILRDKAHFHLDGFTNTHTHTHNCRIWVTENPVLIHEKPLHPERVTVWCAMCSTDVIGPYFFEDEMGRALTVTGDCYQAMITTFLAPAVECMMNQEQSLWFQQDHATCSTARESMACLRQLFPGRLISQYGDLWPPQSAFFLWGYLKDRVYHTKPSTLQELKDSIRRKILSIQQETLTLVMECTVR